MRYAVWLLGVGYYRDGTGEVPTWGTPEEAAKGLEALGFIKEGNATVMPFRPVPLWARYKT